MAIYYCENENNTCPKRDECTRHLESEGKDKATLFKMACIENNDYVLFIKADKQGEKEC